MNKQFKLIIGIIAFIVLIAAAGAGYNYLSNNYEEDNIKKGQTEKPEEKLQAAADFSVLDKGQNEVKLSDNFGKPIIVNFWASWCGPCTSEMPAFNNLYKEYKDEINFMMVNLTDGQRETVEKADKFIAENGYEFSVYYDTKGEAAYKYGVNSVPATLFINEKGEILAGRLGAMSEKTLKEYINKLIGGA